MQTAHVQIPGGDFSCGTRDSVVIVMVVPVVAIPVTVVLMSDVVADGAAGNGSNDGVVVQKVAGDTADDRSLDATLGFRRWSSGDAECGGHRKSDDESLHTATPI